ncbi:SRPBCC family protein [Turneriella parva]|nr:SRPBCC family protein [Turneriella parva]
MTKSIFKYQTVIRTTPEKLWHALTTADIIKEYWFDSSFECDWKVGSSWKAYNDGKLMDSGEIIESVAQKRLVRSWLCEWQPEFKAEGSALSTYEIEPIGECVKLIVTYSIERPNSKYIEALPDGISMVLSNLKSLLETGEPALKMSRKQLK